MHPKHLGIGTFESMVRIMPCLAKICNLEKDIWPSHWYQHKRSIQFAVKLSYAGSLSWISFAEYVFIPI